MGFRVLGFRVLDVGSSVLLLGSGFWVLGSGFWVLGSGFCSLLGFKVLDVRFRV